MKRTILALILLLAGTAPASAAFLGANSPLGESFLNTGIEKVAGDVSLEVPMGCGRAWLERTAECFVAPGAMAGSGLSGGSSAAATYPAKFMEGAADVGEGTPLAESVEIEIPVTFEGFAAPGPEAQAFVNQEIVGPGPESQPFVNQEIVGPGPEAQPFVNQEIVGPGPEAQPFVNQEFAGAGGESPESAAAEAGQAPIEYQSPTIGPKIESQMGPRGWTPQQIDEAIQGGQQIPAINKATGNPAIRYVSPTTGQSVVVDTATGEVIHVGGPGFQYGPGSGDVPLLPSPGR